jgi:hypothetical protein
MGDELIWGKNQYMYTFNKRVLIVPGEELIQNACINSSGEKNKDGGRIGT